MLSNVAIPKYYGQFRDKVLQGKIPICREISMEMNRIDALIDDPTIYYDDQAVEGFIRFVENECTLSDGSPVRMLESFKLWAEQIFGWWYFIEKQIYQRDDDGGHYVRKLVKKRLITKQYLVVARGAAKSMYASFIQSYFLVWDKEAKSQITVAPTMPQTDGVITPLRTMILRSKGPLVRFLADGSSYTSSNVVSRAKLYSTKSGARNDLTGSELTVLPMSIDKLQGYKAKIATIDEWLSGNTREDVIGAVEQGASKQDNWLIIAISSEGTVRNGTGDNIKMELMSILKGEYKAPHISIWYYRLDDISEVGNPSMWIKANPNLDLTVSYETYQMDVERAEKSPAARNDILAKRFGLPLEGYTYYFTYEETLPHKQQTFWECQCAMGADMSRGDDFCAYTFLFPLPNYEFGVKSIAYITEYTLIKLSKASRIKYQEFIDEGSLRIMPGTTLDIMEVYDDLDRYIEENRYDVVAMGFDPYNAKAFVERWSTEHGSFGIEKVIQGAKTESVPLGEIKKLAEDRALLFDQSILTYTMGNSIVLTDTNGNRKLYKPRNEDKIDCVSALMDAFIAFNVHKELFG